MEILERARRRHAHHANWHSLEKGLIDRRQERAQTFRGSTRCAHQCVSSMKSYVSDKSKIPKQFTLSASLLSDQGCTRDSCFISVFCSFIASDQYLGHIAAHFMRYHHPKKKTIPKKIVDFSHRWIPSNICDDFLYSCCELLSCHHLSNSLHCTCHVTITGSHRMAHEVSPSQQPITLHLSCHDHSNSSHRICHVRITKTHHIAPVLLRSQQLITLKVGIGLFHPCERLFALSSHVQNHRAHRSFWLSSSSPAASACYHAVSAPEMRHSFVWIYSTLQPWRLPRVNVFCLLLYHSFDLICRSSCEKRLSNCQSHHVTRWSRDRLMTWHAACNWRIPFVRSIWSLQCPVALLVDRPISCTMKCHRMRSAFLVNLLEGAECLDTSSFFCDHTVDFWMCIAPTRSLISFAQASFDIREWIPPTRMKQGLCLISYKNSGQRISGRCWTWKEDILGINLRIACTCTLESRWKWENSQYFHWCETIV